MVINTWEQDGASATRTPQGTSGQKSLQEKTCSVASGGLKHWFG